MIQDAQVASGKVAGDPRGAAVVLESRGLKKTYGSGKRSHAAAGARRGFHDCAGDGAEVARGGWLGKPGRPPRRGTLRRGTAARRDCPGARHWAISAAGR